jgi:hypothetical protein
MEWAYYSALIVSGMFKDKKENVGGRLIQLDNLRGRLIIYTSYVILLW